LPTKRRKRAVHRIGAITDAQQSHLVCGHYFFDLAGEVDRFVDDAHRRATWARLREQILAEWDRPGRRPVAMWEYDFGLKHRPWPKAWSWPRPIQSEAEMIRQLLLDGTIAPSRRNGRIVIADEVVEIEADWVRWVGLAPMQYLTDPVGMLLQHYGVPRWFTRKHLRAAIEKYEAGVAGEFLPRSYPKRCTRAVRPMAGPTDSPP
jgi:hypothetical protein